MTTRKVIYGGLGVSLAIYAMWWGYMYFGDGARIGNCHRLQEGMSKSDVKSILGRTYDYTGYVRIKGQVHVDVVGRDGTVMLAFDVGDRLVWHAWDETRRRPTVLQRFARWRWGEVRE